MKKASRILAVLTALVLVLGVSTAFAVPGNLSQIENLPECPQVPTMKVKTSAGNATITLSEPLAWLQVVDNWQWKDIISWNEDKTVGTYSFADFKSAPGAGRWNSHWGWTNYDGWVDADKFDGSALQGTSTSREDTTLTTQLPQYAEAVGDGTTVWGYNLFHDTAVIGWGTYDLGFAYDGGLADGTDVKYDAGGQVVSVMVTKTGENYLGSEKTPVKAEILFKQQYGRMFLYEIKEFYDDDSTLTAHYNFNGVLIGVKQ